MGLQTTQLEAFAEVARLKNFSKAAKALNITQSALSQRIINLESELELALIIRDPSGLKLTDEGQNLLRYCRSRDALEDEFLWSLKGSERFGKIRIGGFSSIMRSLVVPIVAELALRNRHLRVELFSRELRELFPLLASNQVDFVLTSEPVDRVEIVSELLGYESNVLVRPRYSEFRSGVFLDHDADDSTTFDFLKLQGRKSEKFERFYLDEVYAIMDGVANGMGEAVLPLHLVKSDKRMRIVDGLKPLKTPIFLQYYKQPFYSKIHTTIVERLLTEIPKKLDI